MDVIKNMLKKIINPDHVVITKEYINSVHIMDIGQNVGHVVKENGIRLDVVLVNTKVSY